MLKIIASVTGADLCAVLMWMVFIIVFLFLLDVIINMIKNIFGINTKKFLAGAGVAIGAMALRDFYKKNHVKPDVEKVEVHEDNNQE